MVKINFFKIKVITFLLSVVCFCNSTAQIVGTPYIIPVDTRPFLDQLGITPSFAFSTRKLREAYTGPAIRLRRATDNSQVDVYFDTNGVVSGNSLVSVSVVGTSGLTLGQSLTLSSYKGTNPLYVTLWWDQGLNGYHGQQGTTIRQPLFTLNSAGASNQYASLQFTGSSQHHVIVNKTMETLLTSGLRGTLFIIARPTLNSTQNSFGFMNPSNNQIRWSSHINWTDGNCYVDFGNAADVNRAFVNSSRLDIYKQYLFLRGASTKTLRVSGTALMINSQQTFNTGLTGGTFGVGLAINSGATLQGFTGNIPEFILFNTDLTASQYQLLENNQLAFWGAN